VSSGGRAMTSVFSRFAPRLQEAIASRLGWTTLRPVQELAGAAILDGKNAVVLAPTAGGKTEAAMFPTLSMLVEHQAEGVGAIYLAPIKALLNNQSDRLGLYTEMVGLSRFLWHGDVESPARKAFIAEPSDLLMTTPESLEVMLASTKVPVAKLFRNLRIVVIDEVHALAGSDRGAHLMSVLERIADHSIHDVQRVGLSATVGNPDVILQWIRGTSKRDGVVVDPPKSPAKRQIAVQLDPELATLATKAAELAKGKKSLLFCESRALTETVADRMRDRGTDVFVHHSSVSLEERRLAEERFAGGGSAAIVCTSTLELGIDVGDLDNVFQANAPGTVSSFLQRMGRTGRRASTTANTTFFCDNPEAVLQAVALVELAREGWVESIPAQQRCWPVLVHQLLAFTLPAGGIARNLAWDKLSRLPDLAGITRFELDQTIDFMVLHDYLFESSGLLSMGDAAERKYGRKNFLELYAVFSSPQYYRVIGPSGSDIGSLEQAFVDNLVEDMTSFLLGGRAWLVHSIDHKSRTVSVRPAPRGKQPSWGGFAPKMLGFEVCQRIKQLLCETTEYPYLAAGAAAALQLYREDFAALLQRGNAIQVADDGARWWTYAGGRINQTLRHAIAELTGWKVVNDNFRLRFEGDGVSHAAVVKAIEALAAPAFWDDADLWQRIVARIPPYRFSKFQAALPPRFELELVGRYLLDLDGARRFILGDKAEAHSTRVADLLRRVISSFPVAEPGPQPLAVEAALPLRAIRLVTTDTDLLALCADLATRKFIALDVETTLFDRDLCLIQVGVDEYSAVIDPRAPIDLEPLARIFESQSIVKVIHNASFERSVLQRANIAIANVFDTLAASRRLRGKQAGGHSLAAVCRRELDKVLDKSQQISDWTRRPLTGAQVNYAALDVEVLVDLFARFSEIQPALSL
jgi:ATP-dependent helicase Lhr and Lhr-like helicase